MKKRVLVTGGCGFIGTSLVNFLSAKGYDICVIDDLSVGQPVQLPPEVTILTKDINDLSIKSDIQVFMPEIVVHLAAMRPSAICDSAPSKIIYANIAGSQNLIDAIEGCDTVSKVIFASSGCVYNGEESMLVEDAPLKPSDIYSLSKITGESLFSLLAKRKKIKCVILRLFDVIGIGNNNPHLIAHIIQQVKLGGREINIDNPNTVRNYIDVKDLAAAFHSVMTKELENDVEIFNIGAENLSAKRIFEYVKNILGTDLKLISNTVERIDGGEYKQTRETQKVSGQVKWKPNINIYHSLENILIGAHLTKYQKHKEYFRSKTKIEIDITYRCNLKCVDCNRSISQAPSKEEMTVEQIDKFILESIESNVRWERICILGGEPTIHPNFQTIIDKILAYRIDYSPDTIIEVRSNGYGKKVQAALQKLSALNIVVSAASFKDNNPIQEDFSSFNVAPEDLEEYKDSNFSFGCWVTETAGIGLTPYGYYPCAVAGGIDRIFGYDLGRKEMPGKNDEMKDLLNTFCRKCGNFKENNFDNAINIIEVKHGEKSTVWEESYKKYKREKPVLTEY